DALEGEGLIAVGARQGVEVVEVEAHRRLGRAAGAEQRAEAAAGVGQVALGGDVHGGHGSAPGGVGGGGRGVVGGRLGGDGGGARGGEDRGGVGQGGAAGGGGGRARPRRGGQESFPAASRASRLEVCLHFCHRSHPLHSQPCRPVARSISTS